MAAASSGWRYCCCHAQRRQLRSANALDEIPLDESVRQLREQLRTVVESYGWRSARYGVLALSLETGDTLYDSGAHDLLAPASNLKLLTTAAALHYLGPDFRYQTFLLADGAIEKGRLKGNLVLYGTGDPGFSDKFRGTDLLEALADSLRDAGVYVVEGDVVGDGTFFSGPLLGEGWDRYDLNDAFAAPSSALSFDENVVTLRVAPSVAGRRPTIHTIPNGAGLPMEVTSDHRRAPGTSASSAPRPFPAHHDLRLALPDRPRRVASNYGVRPATVRGKRIPERTGGARHPRDRGGEYDS